MAAKPFSRLRIIRKKLFIYRPDPANAEAIQNMKPPTNIKEAGRFLGMCGFYRKHVPKFVLIAAPLTDLTRSKVEVRCTDSCQQAFEKLKAKLIETPIIVRAGISKQFVVTTDASDIHVRGVPSQAQADRSDRTVGCFSKRLKPAETRHSDR